ncbi:hypothetical protein UPYG_G00083180 [Umbra pygmaea]|uniref:Gypsy retrotransposon integrase-like protein 1 n=1 Tax=Umbra pygmaea TaxID=75934 RepID=A0ABD0XE48_UMBPY
MSSDGQILKIGGVSATCLLDTGSQVSTITESFFREHLSGADDDMLSTAGWLKITAANGLDIPYLGYLELDVETMGMTLPECGFLVVKEPPGTTSQPGLIGMNIISRCRQLVHAEFDTTLGGVLQSDWREVFQQMQRASSVKKATIARVAGRDSVHIPASSVATIMAKGLNGVSPSESSPMQLEPSNTPLPNGIIVIPTIVSSQGHLFPVQLVHLSQEDVWLQPRTRLGTMSVAECVQENEGCEVKFHRISASVEQISVDRRDSQLTGDRSKQILDSLHLGGTPEEKTQLSDVISRYADVFALDEDDLGYTDKVQHEINLVDDTPVNLPYRHLPPAQYKEPLAGEPANPDDVEFDDCVAICNLVNKGVSLPPELVEVGVQRCRVRQIRALEAGLVTEEDEAQGNTPTLAGYTKAELRTFQDKDPTLKIFRRFWDQERAPSGRERRGLPKPVLSLLKHWNYTQKKDGLLYRVVSDPKHGECDQLLLPACLREQVLKSVHDSMGHQGIERTLNLLRSRCFWVGMYEDVEQWIKACERCVLTKMPQPKIQAPMKSFLAYRPLEVVAVDFTVLEPASDGRENVLVLRFLTCAVCILADQWYRDPQDHHAMPPAAPVAGRAGSRCPGSAGPRPASGGAVWHGDHPELFIQSRHSLQPDRPQCLLAADGPGASVHSLLRRGSLVDQESRQQHQPVPTFAAEARAMPPSS